MSTYLKNAVDVPAPQLSGVMVDPNGATVATPSIAMGVDYGASGPLVVATDHNATLQDMQGRFGSPGGYGILFGCGLSVSGTNVVVAAGAVGIDGYQPITAGSYALTDGVNVQNWIWAKKGRTSPIAVVTGSLLPPLGGAALLGMIVMNGGVGAVPDLSGVVYRRIGGWWWRKTGDSGMPGDTPSGSLLFTSHSMGDNTFWLWTGEAYIQQPSPAVDLSAYIRKDGTVPFTGDQSHGAHKITNLANGVAAQDAVTVAQLVSASTILDGVTLDYGGAGGSAEIKPLGVGTGQIAAHAVTNGKAAQMPADTIKSNLTGGAADAADNTFADVADALTGTAAHTLAAGNDPRFKRGCALLLCSAFTPVATGADSGEIPVPYDPADGTTSITWTVRRITLRVNIAGGAPSVTVEKSTAGDAAFSPTSVGTVTLTSGHYQGSVTSALGTVASGDTLRFNVGTLATAQNWTITVELEQN